MDEIFTKGPKLKFALIGLGWKWAYPFKNIYLFNQSQKKSFYVPSPECFRNLYDQQYQPRSDCSSKQTGWTQIRLLLLEQSDLGPHCLPLYLHLSIMIVNICSRRMKRVTFFALRIKKQYEL